MERTRFCYRFRRRQTGPMAGAGGYDALLLVSFGGPEGPEDVLPFLERVTAGRGVPRERLEAVAEHYHHVGGVSPINGQNRALLDALRTELAEHGPDLPLYWGNRNWHPLLADTLRQMRDDGLRCALAFVTSAFASWSGCRQYLDELDRARDEVGPGAPEVHKLRLFSNHPGFIEPMAANVRTALAELPAGGAGATVMFTAHSVPLAMAEASDYVAQLADACGLVAERAGAPRWQLAFQSRSGPPSVSWLEPDIADALTDLHAEGVGAVVVAPIGFVSDHMEVVWDLDVEASEVADRLGLPMARAATVGTDPAFVSMVRSLVLERTAAEGTPVRMALGGRGPSPDRCSPGCCTSPTWPPRRS
ncbi:ferrochelatase [soil metagenome]